MPFDISAAPDIFQWTQQSRTWQESTPLLVIYWWLAWETPSKQQSRITTQTWFNYWIDARKRNWSWTKTNAKYPWASCLHGTENGVKPDPVDIMEIRNMQKPQARAGVRRLIGMVTYRSTSLNHLSDICEPLRQLTRQDVEFCWTDVHNVAFEQI